MRLGFLLSRYIGRQFLLSIGLVFLVIVTVAFMIDAVELSRRASSNEQIAFSTVVELALLRVPFLAQQILPFAVLFGTMLTYLWLTRTNELVVSRAAGVSVWQFLLPSIVLALALGIFVVTVFNDLSSAMVLRFEQMETRLLKGKASLLDVSGNGLWLREGDGNQYFSIHATRVAQSGRELYDVTIWAYKGEDEFVERVDAETALLAEGYWDLRHALVTRPDEPSTLLPTYRLTTDLTVDRIQESFASPETMSFWELPEFIETVEKAGFSALRHKIHFYSMLAIPLLLAAMVLVAATFSLRLTRQGRTGLFVLAGLMSGFLLYFMSGVSQALGLAGGLPPLLAAWAPAAIFALLGMAMLFHLEDG